MGMISVVLKTEIVEGEQHPVVTVVAAYRDGAEAEAFALNEEAKESNSWADFDVVSINLQ